MLLDQVEILGRMSSAMLTGGSASPVNRMIRQSFRMAKGGMETGVSTGTGRGGKGGTRCPPLNFSQNAWAKALVWGDCRAYQHLLWPE